MSVQYRALVNEVMEDADYNSKEARNALIKRAAKDHVLRDELLKLGADQMIRDYFAGQRRGHAEASEPESYSARSTPETPEKQKSRERNAERRLFWDRYALFGHMPLKVAGKIDLRESELARRKQAQGNIRCADFEAALGADLPKTKKVGEFFAITKIIEIAKVHNVIPTARA